MSVNQLPPINQLPPVNQSLSVNQSTPSKNNIVVKKTLPEKPIVNDTHFMVSTPHELASQAAKKMLDKGGSAADAAIASHFVLSVVTPEATGIGGGGFINVYDKKQDKVTIYDARETAPSKMLENEFDDANGNTPPYMSTITGGRAVAIPSILKGLKELHDNHGKLPWKDLVEPAIDAAENGFPMPKRLTKSFSKYTHYTRLSENAKRYYRPDGSIKAAGEMVTNPELATTLKKIASDGIDDFYTGKIAEDIINTATKTRIYPSKISLDDLKKYKVIKREPAQIDYKDFRIYAPPAPSSGGIAVLQTLKLLEPFELEKYDSDNLQIETLINNGLRLAYRDRNSIIGDPDFVKIDEKKLLSDTYLKPRQELLSISAKAIDKDDKPAERPNQNMNTSHSSFIDKDGNAVSMTSSVQFIFGSGLETDSGFLLNSSISDFTLDGYKTNSPNKIEPDKRPRSAMCPLIVKDIKHNDIRLLIGTPGGAAIIAFLVRRMIDILDHKIPIHKAVARPNYIPEHNDKNIEYEENLLTNGEKEYLKNQNFNLIPTNLYQSGFQVVEKDKGFLSGASDPRRDGTSIGG